MLRKSERLSRQAFSGFFASGLRFHFSTHTLVVSPAASLKVAVVVSKKVAKKAHERNTIRRRLYAYFAKQKIQNGLTGVYIVLTKPPFSLLTRAEQVVVIEKSLRDSLSRLPKGR